MTTIKVVIIHTGVIPGRLVRVSKYTCEAGTEYVVFISTIMFAIAYSKAIYKRARMVRNVISDSENTFLCVSICLQRERTYPIHRNILMVNLMVLANAPNLTVFLCFCKILGVEKDN